MSSIERQIPKPSRRLSFRTKLLSTATTEPSSYDSLNNGNLSSGNFNPVRGSIRRFRRVSGSVTNNTVNSSPLLSSNSTDTKTEATTAITIDNNTKSFNTPFPNNTALTSAETPPQSPTFSKIQRLGIAIQQKSRLKELNISELKAVVEEKGAELGSKAVEFGSIAKETSLGWGKKGRKAVVERWKKRKEDFTPNGIPHPVSAQKYFADTNIFGTPLKIAVRLTRVEKDRKCIHEDPARYWLPAIMVRCLEFLDLNGTEEVGLYRIPGGTTTVSRMRAIFHTGADLNFLQSSREDPNAVATLMKMYLRELPEPILTEELLPEFNACAAKYNGFPLAGAMNNVFSPGSLPNMSNTYYTAPTIPDELPRALAPIVSRLPPYQFHLLRVLCTHLARVDSKSNINKMNLSNLGLIFCPSLGISSMLFKAFVSHSDIVFGGGCQTEEQEIAEEEHERAEKEKEAPEVYHKTNMTSDFSKSFEDLLLPESGHIIHSSNHSIASSSSSSSSFTSTYLSKDNFSTLSQELEESDNLNEALHDGVSLTIPSIKTTNSSSSLASSTLSTSSKDNQTNNARDTNNPFGDDEFVLSLNASPLANHEHRQSHPVTDIPSPPLPVATNPFFRPRSRSTGARNVPLSSLEFSSESSESSEDDTNLGGDYDDDSVEPTSPTLMTFDYLDGHGTKNLGVLNLSIRASHQWVLHHNGVDGDSGTATAAWIRRERPSLEEQEKWKKTLLVDLNGDESVNEAGDGIERMLRDDEESISRKLGDEEVGVGLLGGRGDTVVDTSRGLMPISTGIQVPVGDLINL